MPQRVVPVAAVLALAGAAILLVASHQTSRHAELLSLRIIPQAQLYDLDPKQAGPMIYSEINKASGAELEDYLKAAKEQARLDRARTLERAAEKQAAGEERLKVACIKDPSLPGCPYHAPISFDITGVDPDKAGPLVYAMTNEKTSKDLKMIQDAYLKRWKDLKYEQDVVRFQKEMASAERMVQTCNKDPSLPGCPFYPDVKPAVYPNEGMPASGSLIYADENSNANQRLEVAEIENKAVMDRIHAAEKALMQANIQKGIERMATTCQMNPSLPGCPY